jgi:hypothetical protein
MGDSKLDKDWIRFEAVRALCKRQTSIKPSSQFLYSMLSFTEESVQTSINFNKTKREEKNNSAGKDNEKLKPIKSQMVFPATNYPESFQFLESFEKGKNEKEYLDRGAEAFRKHLQNHIENSKTKWSKDYPSTRGKGPKFTDDVKMLIAWNHGATVTQISKVFGLDVVSVKTVKQRCKKYALPVRKDTSGRKKDLVIFDDLITSWKVKKTSNKEWLDWLEL